MTSSGVQKWHDPWESYQQGLETVGRCGLELGAVEQWQQGGRWFRDYLHVPHPRVSMGMLVSDKWSELLCRTASARTAFLIIIIIIKKQPCTVTAESFPSTHENFFQSSSKCPAFASPITVPRAAILCGYPVWLTYTGSFLTRTLGLYAAPSESVFSETCILRMRSDAYPFPLDSAPAGRPLGR